MQPVQREWQQRHDIARRSSSTRRETSCTFNPPASRAVECGAGVPQIRGYITCGECIGAMATVPLIRSEVIVQLYTFRLLPIIDGSCTHTSIMAMAERSLVDCYVYFRCRSASFRGLRLTQQSSTLWLTPDANHPSIFRRDFGLLRP